MKNHPFTRTKVKDTNVVDKTLDFETVSGDATRNDYNIILGKRLW